MAKQVHCIKYGIEAEGLAFPPVPGALGKKIMENVSAQAWQDWLQHQTTLINEYRLSLNDPKAKAYLLEELNKYFFGDGSEKPADFEG